MPAISYHIIVEGNPAIIYASRNGSPEKVLPTLNRFLEKFWQERDTSGETDDTPECLVAQIIVRFGFEICEDDFSNLRVGIHFNPNAQYLYVISGDRTLTTWVPEAAYKADPTLGLSACQPLNSNPIQIATPH
ncbi:histidine kinase [Oscillatoria sp. FACHB-1407]|uniref:histidine kinase n=1 Tax=Oscillatoria sp. FACHB-1407 TaxID=2692847 RepID=UPI0016884CDD|nr:histidine kinase [Oscillatoria sp. FACHB-1407]MBD2464314.1 histidine kinase [Oscillatoria sp. FACHB-1407]